MNSAFRNKPKTQKKKKEQKQLKVSQLHAIHFNDQIYKSIEELVWFGDY